jgi:hypothetical protein
MARLQVLSDPEMMARLREVIFTSIISHELISAQINPQLAGNIRFIIDVELTCCS